VLVFAPWPITTSETLRIWLASGAIIGGILSYVLTTNLWAGKSREARRSAAKKYLGLCVVSYVVLVIIPIVLLRPLLAMKYHLVRELRNFLLEAMPLPNLIVSLGSLLACYFLIGAILVSSKQLANPHPPPGKGSLPPN